MRAASASRLAALGALLLSAQTTAPARVEVREEVEARDGVVARRYWVPRAPQGALTLDVPLEGARVTKLSAGAVALETAQGPRRYGPAVWVDASGRRTPIPWSGGAGALRLVVGEALLQASTYPAVLDPLLSPVVDA